MASGTAFAWRRKGDDLIYADKVDNGFDKVSAADLQKRLKPLIRKSQPYAKRIVHKGIRAEIEYRAKSARGEGPVSLFQRSAEDL
jgi:bifunctional non-homologous end joining protein LigD